MLRERIQLDSETTTRFIAAVIGNTIASEALVVFPEVLEASAQHFGKTLEARGCTTEVCIFPESYFRDNSPEKASEGWVPAVENAPELLVLLGVPPWEQPFDQDYLVEIEAMKRREALLAAGRRLIFIDWPRGARLDKEIDLPAPNMARIYHQSIDIDYAAMRRTNQHLREAVAGTKHVHLTCPEGTDIRFSITDRKWFSEDCLLSAEEPAVFLPGGEIYVSAHEQSAEGVVAFRYCGMPRRAYFGDGLLTAVVDADGVHDTQLEEEFGAGFEPLCEFGIGSNPWAPPWQIGTIYEKSAGTAHVAVGGNAHFGGERQSARHADLIIREPTIRLDDKPPLPLPDACWKDANYEKVIPRS